MLPEFKYSYLSQNGVLKGAWPPAGGREHLTFEYNVLLQWPFLQSSAPTGVIST